MKKTCGTMSMHCEICKCYTKCWIDKVETGVYDPEYNEEQKWQYCPDLRGHCEVGNDCTDCPYGIERYYPEMDDRRKDWLENYAAEAAGLE